MTAQHCGCSVTCLSDVSNVPFQLCALSAGGESDLEDVALAPLRDTERFGIVRRLLATADINLERHQSAVRAVTCKVPNLSPLVLYVSLNALRALGPAHQ